MFDNDHLLIDNELLTRYFHLNLILLFLLLLLLNLLIRKNYHNFYLNSVFILVKEAYNFYFDLV